MEAIKRIHATSSTVTFDCDDNVVIGSGEFRASFGKVNGFILYSDTLHYEKGKILSQNEREKLNCLYQEYLSPHDDFIDWDI